MLCLIDIYSKNAWAVPLKDKKCITISNAFQKILHEFGRKPNKIYLEKGNEFYNKSMKSRLKENDIEMYSIQNEGKSVVAERFIRTLKNKIYKFSVAEYGSVFSYIIFLCKFYSQAVLQVAIFVNLLL